MNTTQAPICMAEEFWMNSQLSLARFSGRVRVNGNVYLVVDKLGRDLMECTFAADRAGSDKAIPEGESADLVRIDFIPYYKKLGRDKFLQVLKDNPTATHTMLKEIYKEMTSKPKKEEPKPLDLFGEYNAPKDKYCRTCIHRKRYELNEHSKKVVQCCELIPSNRSRSGYHTIKTTDLACNKYEEETYEENY